MIYDVAKKEIRLSKELNELDRFVVDFTDLLGKYVIVSGYVSILLGRTRATEDVDLLVPEMSKKEFNKLWEESIKSGFWCINTSISEEAYTMLREHAIRFSKKGKPIPNIEFKTIKTDLDEYSYKNKIKVAFNGGKFFISPLEMQIAYKLFLAADGIEEEFKSDKDIEDAKHLYHVFKEKINKEELIILVNKLSVKNKLKLLE